MVLAEGERLVQTERLRQILLNANRIWSDPAFPADHRLEVDVLAQGIGIEDYSPTPYNFHPSLKPEVLKLLNDTFNAAVKKGAVIEVAWYDHDTRKITVSEKLLQEKEELLRRAIYHEAGTDISDRLWILTPDNYTDQQRELIFGYLPLLFPESYPVGIEKTTIRKTGFREHLIVEGFPTTDMRWDSFYTVELYPTIFEMITEHMMGRGGIKEFERDLREGKLKRRPFEDHPRVASLLGQVGKVIDWRELLNAYKIGDTEESVKYLVRLLGNLGTQIYRRFEQAIKQDETMHETAAGFTS